MAITVVRYRPTQERGDENHQLVEAVYAELASSQPEGLRYATWRLTDGVFVHVAEISVDPNPLATNVAFARFQDGIAERCLPGKGPNAQSATLVGSYRFSIG